MSGLYSKAKEKLWTAGITITSTVQAVGVNSAIYTVDYANHEFYSDITSPVTSPVTLTGVTYSGGKFTANSTTLGTPSSQCDAIVIFQSTGVSSTSPLICYIDDGDGFPALPADGSIPIDWDTDLGIASL